MVARIKGAFENKMAVEDPDPKLKDALAEEVPPAAEDEASTPAKIPTGTKRKRPEPRDPNAPKRPCSAYIYYSAVMRPKMREEKPEMGMSERSKYIGKEWASLDAEQKKVYQDMADADKQRYIKEYIAYQETDTYKQFIRNKHPGLKKKPKQSEKETAASKKKDKTPVKSQPGKMPVSCQQQFIPGSNIPIFSEDFLKHNRDQESQLRKLRQTSANLEEENALLSRHVENMKAAVEKVQKEIKKQEEKNQNLHAHLSMIREVLAASFKDIPLPGSKETPTASTIDTYMSKLQTAISSEPNKYPVLVEKVSSITKHLEKVLKEKMSKDAAKGTVLDEGEEGEEGEGKEEKASGNEEPMAT